VRFGDRVLVNQASPELEVFETEADRRDTISGESSALDNFFPRRVFCAIDEQIRSITMVKFNLMSWQVPTSAQVVFETENHRSLQSKALSCKSAVSRTVPFLKQTGPTTFITVMPRAV
jgi:hypothetical protein